MAIECLLSVLVLLTGLGISASAQDQRVPDAFFLSSHAAVRLDLDTGDQHSIELRGEPLAYRQQALSQDADLLCFVDRELAPGFVVLDRERAVRIAVRDASAWRFGDSFLLGLAVANPVEGMVGTSRFSLWSLTDFRRLLRMDRTIPLSSIALDYRNEELLASADDGLLLFRFRPAVENDPNYPWRRELTFLLLSSESGKLLWKRKLNPGFPLADIDLLWQDDDALLVAGRVDLSHYYYACFDASSGRLRWQLKTRRFPLVQPDYPYSAYAWVLPACRQGDELMFGTLGPEPPYRAVARLDLATGEFGVSADAAELRAMRTAYLSRYTEPEVERTVVRVLEGLGTLSIIPYQRVELVGPKHRWSVPYLPTFGGNLDLQAWGQAYLVLAERPGRRLTLGYQRRAYVLEAASGRQAAPLEGELVLFQPWSPVPGVQVLLTTEELVELTGSGVQRCPFRMQES